MTESFPANRDDGGSGPAPARGSSSIIGKVLANDFEIRRKIGQGGMGAVYEAWQRSLNRAVAVKILGNSLGLTASAITRFQREAQAAAKLHHTNIVPIFAQGEHEGLYFYVMELVEGRGLNDLIAAMRGDRRSSAMEATETKLVVGTDESVGSGRSVDPDATASMPSFGADDADARRSATLLTDSTAETFDDIADHMASAADALEYAHRHGVIHRDIKPHNFLYGDDGRLRITDFGLARVLEQPGMTMTGEFIGSPLYMSPEQITGGQVQVTERTDIYSLGATMYEWLTGQPPFPGDTREQVITKIITTEAVPPRTLNPRIPIDLETICLQALEKSPSRRYASAGAMAEDLRRFLRRESIRAKREGVIGRTSKFVDRNRAAVLVGGVILAAASTLWSIETHRGRVRLRESIAEQKQLAERVAVLEAEKTRFTEEIGDLPLERSVADFGAKVLSDVAGAVAGSGLLSLPDPVPEPPAPPIAPQSPTEMIALTQQDRQLIDSLVSEFIGQIRARTASRISFGRPDNPTGRVAAEYFRDALAASSPNKSLSLANLTLQNEFDHFDALSLRAMLYLQLSEFERARQDAETLIHFRDGAAAGYLVRGLVTCFTGQPEASLADLDQAIQLEPRTPGAWVARGAARVRAGRYLAAFDDFDRAVSLSPGHAAARRERQQADVRIRYSIREVSERLGEGPDDYDLLVRRGDLYYLVGDYALAMADYNKALTLNEVPTPYLIEKLVRTRQKLTDSDRPGPDSKTQSSLPPANRNTVPSDAPDPRLMTWGLVRRILP